MKPTDRSANTAFTPKTGLFAMLCGLLCGRGNGGSSVCRPGRASHPFSRLKRCVPVLLCAVVGVLAFTVVPALALKAHVYSSSFGGEGSGPGQFKEPSGVAVNDATGDVYVVDKGNNRVQEFNSTGTTVLAEFNGAVAPSGAFEDPEAIAVDNSGDALDPSKEDVYVTDKGHNIVDKFSASGTYLGQITKGSGGASLETLYGVAVDPEGRVWVYQSSGEIDDYTHEEPNQFVATRKSPFGSSAGFTVDSEDDLYVNRGSEEFGKLSSSGGVLIEAVDGEPSSAAAVDLSTNNVYVDNVNSIAAFTPAGSLLERFGSEQLTDSRGVAVNAASNVAYASDSAANAVKAYRAVILPTVTTGSATNVTEPVGTPGEDTATLGGTVDPEGVPLTSCKFEYVTDEAYGASRVNAVQMLAFTGTREGEGGTFTLTFEGDTTAPIPYSPSQEEGFPENIASALAALPSVGGHRFENVKVSGPVGGPYKIEFTGARGDTKLPPLTANSSGLTPPGAQVTVAVAVEGGDGWEAAAAEACAPEASKAPTGSGAVSVSANVAGLTADTLYHYRLLAGNADHELDNGETKGEAYTFIAPARPRIGAEVVSNLESSSATVGAQINPGGAPTSYRVEYGPCATPATCPSSAYGSSTPQESVAGALGAVGVQQALTGLQAGVEYHFRFVATNIVGTVLGEGVSVTAAASTGASASTLPDNRAYELVSSPSSNANVYPPEGEFVALANRTYRLVRASSAGDAVVYLGDPPPEGAGAGDIGGRNGNEYIAKRGPGGWTQSDLQLSSALWYQGFSSDLSVGVLSPEEPIAPITSLSAASPAAPENCIVPPAPPPLFSYTSDDRGYHALLSSTPTQAPTDCTGEFAGGNAGTGTVPQYSDLLFQSQYALTSEAARAGPYQNLYDSVGGRLHLVNVLPDGEPEPGPDAQFPPTSIIFPEGEGRESPIGPATLGAPNDISADGSRVFWRSLKTGDLYVRENPDREQSAIVAGSSLVNGEQCAEPAKACTVQIDASQTGGVGGDGAWRDASPDGSKVYFTDCNRLTTESTAVSTEGCAHEASALGGHPEQAVVTGNDLYEYDTASGRLSDLTIDENAGDPLRADVQGVLGTSENGEYVYFVAGGALAPGSEVRKCQQAGTKNAQEEKEAAEEQEGKAPPGRGCNLYLLHSGKTSFIATLSPKDSIGERNLSIGPAFGDWVLEAGGRTAQVTPDGHSVLFRSVRPLTGYDNQAVNPGTKRSEPVPEVFVYDADSGRIVCASCNPHGTPPTSNLKLPAASMGEGGTPSELLANGAFLPLSNNDTFLPRLISEDGGRVFFVTGQPLAPQAVNGLQNVYEWEREDEGTCPAGRPQGCIYLLSGGTSTDESYFLDASANGNDVFFRTRAKLVPEARNENMALYDARVGGGFSETSTACTGTGCQGVPPSPPIFATPSSVTFNGTGNFQPPAPLVTTVKCKRGFAKKHNRCVKAKIKHKKKTRRKKVGNKRRGK